MNTLTVPALADHPKARSAAPSLLQRLGAAIAEGRRRKALRLIHERLSYGSPGVLAAAGLKRVSLANDEVLPLV